MCGIRSLVFPFGSFWTGWGTRFPVLVPIAHYVRRGAPASGPPFVRGLLGPTGIVVFPVLVLESLRLAPLGPPVLEPHLDTCLGQVDLHGQVLPSKHVWVVGLSKGRLQLLQLLQSEGGPVPPLLAPHEALIVDRRVVRVGGVCGGETRETESHYYHVWKDGGTGDQWPRPRDVEWLR